MNDKIGSKEGKYEEGMLLSMRTSTPARRIRVARGIEDGHGTTMVSKH